jgi:hypothetical protein
MSWKRAPATVWIFVALMLATLAVAALPGDPTIESWPWVAFFTVLWTVLLLARSAIGWWIITGLYALFALVMVAATVWPWDAGLAGSIALTFASLAALLAPSTRAWVGVGARRRDAQPAA